LLSVPGVSHREVSQRVPWQGRGGAIGAAIIQVPASNSPAQQVDHLAAAPSRKP